MFLEGNKWGSVKFSGLNLGALVLIPHLSQIAVTETVGTCI